MMTMKFGGVLITGVAAFLLANKALNVIDNSTKRICEASKWKNYYKCMNNDKSSTEQIVPPGYSIKTTSGIGDTDGDKVSKDMDDDLAKAIVSFCKEVTKKSIDSLKKPSETQEGASEDRTEPNDGTEFGSEGQGEASESETCEDSEKVTNVDDEKGTDDNETVD